MTEASTLDYRDPEWVAQQLGIDKNAVYRYLDEGTLPGLRLGRKWLISESGLAEFLRREEQVQTERRRAGFRSHRAPPFDKILRRARHLPITERANRALASSRQEALQLGHDHLGQEHLLLGIANVEDAVAAKVLAALNIDVRAAIESVIGRAGAPASGDLRLTPRAKRSLELAVEEARRDGLGHFGTEHILLGILVTGEGLGYGLLERHGVTEDAARKEIERLRASANGESAVAS